MGPDFACRQKKLKGLMEKKGLDALVTSDAKDIFYYTGYSGLDDDRLFMLFASVRPTLLVSPLENDAGTKYRNVAYVNSSKDFVAHLKGFSALGYDERSLSLLLFQEMKKALKAKLVPAGKMMEIQRIVKDEYEIGQLKKAATLTGRAMERAVSSLYGKAEKQIADVMEMEFRKLGTSESFETIVCAGAHSSFVHHKPDATIVKANDVALVDTGCRLGGYCTDITRMFFGRLDPRQKKVYEDVKNVHDEIIGSIRAGTAYKEIEELHKKLLAKKGYRPLHGFGHGIGLSVHESAGKTLRENTVLTVEPGVYVKDLWGFRVEDMILVKKNGAEVLSKGIPVL